MKLQNHVISLKNALQRRQHIEAQFGQQNIDFQFFDAVTTTEVDEYCKILNINFAPDALTSGEQACFISHAMLWYKMVVENTHHMAIFEDDVFLGENAKQFLTQSDWLVAEWHIVKLEAFSKKVLMSKPKALSSSDRGLAVLKGRHLGGAGYILDLQFAKHLLHIIQQNPIIEPLDHILFDPAYHQTQYHLYQMTPALCIQGYLYETENNIFFSGLENQRVVRRKGESKARGVVAKLQREFKRLLVQINTFLHKKPMQFR